MKKLLGLLLIVALPMLAGAQILTPVKWDYSAKKIGEGQYILHLTAFIDNGWHIYAQDAGKGPIPTSFQFQKSDKLHFKGKVREVGKEYKEFDKAFNSVLKFYKNKVDFVQYVQVDKGVKSVKGTLEYMVCNNVNCLPPKDIDFDIKL